MEQNNLNQKPNKKTPILVIVILCIMLTAVVASGIIYYLAKEERPETKGEENIPEFMLKFKDETEKYEWQKLYGDENDVRWNIGYTYPQFNWLNEKNEVDLVEGCYFNIYISGPEETDSGKALDVDIAGINKKIELYFSSKGFTKNEKNSSKDCFDPLIGFEKNDIKCQYSSVNLSDSNPYSKSFTVTCGRINESVRPDFRKIYSLFNSDKDICYEVTADIEGNFAYGGHHGSGGGAAFIAKKENGEWKNVGFFQDTPFCNTLLENKVPPEFYEKYVEENCQTQEAESGIENYEKLYNERYK
jgi:hypothetical protein